jgi:hypothetical protein
MSSSGSGTPPSGSYFAGVAPLWRFVKFLTGAGWGRLAFSFAFVYFAVTASSNTLLVLIAVVDVLQLSVRRGRWLLRIPLYTLAGLLLALAAVAAAARLVGVESSLLGAGGTLKQAADGLRRTK